MSTVMLYRLSLSAMNILIINSHTGTPRHNERNKANDSNTELLSSDSEYDSDFHTSTSENNSDLDSDDSEMDGFVKHSYAVLFVPADKRHPTSKSTLTVA